MLANNNIDIFGKRRSDYATIRAYDSAIAKAKAAGKNLIAPRMKDHQFNNPVAQAHRLHLLNSFAGSTMQRNLRDNAAGIEFFQSNFAALEATIEEVLYRAVRRETWVPTNRNIPEGAQQYIIRVVNKYGRGRIINHRGDNAGTATASMSAVANWIFYAGIDAEWTLEDLRASVFAGLPIDAETLEAAAEASAQHMDEITLGIAPEAPEVKGLVNFDQLPGFASDKPQVIQASKTIAASTPLEIVTEINKYIGTIIENTNEIFPTRIADILALYMPVAQYNRLVADPVSDQFFGGKTIFEYLERGNPWSARTGQPIELRSVIELKGAGTAGSDRMLIGFPTSNRVWEQAVPIMPRIIGIDSEGKRIIRAPLEYKISPVKLKRPGGLLYVDNI